MKILVLDNYDSFTYNLVHLIEEVSGITVDVFRNDQITIEQARLYDRIVLSPGPGIPDEAGILKPLIKALAPHKCIFGVCLGMQAIAEVFGGTLENLTNVFHGVSTKIIVTDRSEELFSGVPETFDAGRYHSWAVSAENLPDCLQVTAVDESKSIMALRHVKYDVRGVQFHPESIMTPEGKRILANWLKTEYFPVDDRVIPRGNPSLFSSLNTLTF